MRRAREAVWQDWTPTVTASAGTITSYTITAARWIWVSNIVTARFDITITNAGSGSATLLVTPPVTPASGASGNVFGIELATTGKAIGGFISGGKFGLALADGNGLVVSGYRINCVAVFEPTVT